MSGQLTRNWGRWGKEDQLGALNLLTDERRLEALRTARNGRLYSLAHEVNRASPVTPGRHPTWHTTSVRVHGRGGSADDVLTMHSHSGTHLDALSHYWGDEGLYNATDPSVITSAGAGRLGVEQIAGIVTRAAFVDVSDVCPRDASAHGFEITAELLESRIAASGIALQPGDALLYRTGWVETYRADRPTYDFGEPGISAGAAEWLARQDVVLVGADNWGVEAYPPPVRRQGLIVHRLLLNGAGAYLLENLDLDGLAEAGPGVYTLIVAPLRISGGVGSPVNPLVVT